MSRMFINDVEYETPYELDAEMWTSGMIITARTPGFTTPVMETFNHCEHCGRFDVRPKIAHGWEQAEEFGWIRRVGVGGERR